MKEGCVIVHMIVIILFHRLNLCVDSRRPLTLALVQDNVPLH